MGNNASKPAEDIAPAASQEVVGQDLADYDEQLDDQSSDTTSIRDDWSHDGNYDRVVDDWTAYDRNEDVTFAQQVDQMHAHNDIIASAFADELRWVEDNGRDILSAWLSASKIYRDAFASRAPESFEATADLIEDEWRAVVKRESCLPVEHVANLHYKLNDISYIADRLLNQGLHPPLIPLFVDYLRLGFDYQDLLLEFTDELAVHGGDLEATKEYLESIFDPCDPYHRIYWAVRWLDVRNNDDGYNPYEDVASPSGQLRSPERGALSALSNNLPNAPGFETSPTQISPAESFIRFPSASPTQPASPFTPRNDNNFIIRNMCKDFRWLAKRGWPPQASWKFVTAMVRTRISSSGDDIGRAIDSVYGTMPLYTDSRLVKLEIHQWRDLALQVELRPTLEELPNAELRDRMTKIVEDAMARDFDFYWTLEQWNKTFKENSISRRQSVSTTSDVRNRLENFHEFILEQSAEEVLREWVPRLFHCLDRDSDDEDDDPPARGSPHPTFEEVMNGLFDAPDSDQDGSEHDGSGNGGSDHNGSDHDGSDHDGSGYGGFGHDSSEPEDEDADDTEMCSSESEPSSTEEADIVSDDISMGSTEEGDRYSPRLEGDENDLEEDNVVVRSPRAPPSSPPVPSRSSPLTSLWNAINPNQPLSSSRASQATATTDHTARNSPYNSSPPARQWSSSPPRLPSTPRLLPTSPNYAATPSPMQYLPTRDASSPLSSYHTAFSTPPNRIHSTPTPFAPPMPSTPRASDIQGPTSPPFNQTFDTLVRSSPPSNRRRPTPHHRDRRIQRVDNLRYENRLEEPRRLPNTPTASHLPPRPRDRTRTPSRACPTCGRRWRDRSQSRSKNKSKSPSPPAPAPAAERTTEGRVKKTPPPTKQQRKKKPKKTPSSSQPAADSEKRYPTRERKAPARYEG
ncbi:hypothetical protein CBER1_10239 [Cercospora berteroae]|uniref:Uncharacterized protein n=1 Tax=Cercospora berteroae TaxID=357750 RepID=A0A2S6BXE1_9PEZI|nr:hypothetical protein CBER1_10239 [Cercospora berteroae]